ncbi:MAG: hypothetical protein GY720_19775 [bacterium]|nr:hypothetical protein [bacterium]
MSASDGGLPRSAWMAIGGLALFGGAILVSLIAGGGSQRPVASGADSGSPSDVDCFLALEDLEFINDRLESPDLLDDMIAAAKHGVTDADSCPAVRQGETVLIVEGLPGVSGAYSSRQGNLSLEGWTLDEASFDQPVNRCFVDSDHVFRTKAVHAEILDESNKSGRVTDAGSLTTIDVGVTGGGGAFAAVVFEIGTVENEYSASEPVALYVPTHNYNPGQDGAMKVEFDVWDKNNWTGVATFTSTAEAETYNNRDYSPWTDAQWLGSPNYAFTITLICK